MSKAEVKKEEEQSKKNISVSIHEIGAHNDKIWKIATLDFKNSDDRGFEFETSNLRFVLRAKKEDYYNLVHTLFSRYTMNFKRATIIML